MLLMFSGSLLAQIPFFKGKNKKQVPIQYDTIQVEAGKLLIFRDTLFVANDDTTLILPAGQKVKVKENPYVKSNRFYDSLEHLSDRSLVTRKLHSWLFRNSVTELSDSVTLIRSEAPFEPFEGRRIGKINVSTLEFLGGSISDSTPVVRTTVSKIVNGIHADTRESIISKYLLFKSGDPVSSFLLADNERILRELPFILDARITLVPRSEDSGVVDVFVVVQDRMSLFLDGSWSGFDDFSIEVGTRSILGTGNKISILYDYEADERPRSGYELRFENFNLRRSFITTEVTFSRLWNKKGYTVRFNREFLTPETKWAGSVEFGDLDQIRMEDIDRDSLPNEDDSLRIPYQRNYQDVWVGRSFLFKGGEERKNITVSTRIYRQEFHQRPFVSTDSNYFFHSNVLWLNQVELTKRQFLKSTMIQAFGITEDVPIGYQAGMVAGYEFGEFVDRPYWGVKAGIGDFWDNKGYFSITADFGGYLTRHKLEDGAVIIKGLYFTPLLRIGRNRFRQFVTLNYLTAINPRLDERFELKDQIRGISNEVQGDIGLSANFESVLFHPLRFYGFRMASFGFFDFGWISFDQPVIESKNFQASTGLGIRLRNESLLFRTIQLRLGYLTETSSLKFSFSFSAPVIFDSFRSGKPEVVTF
ncbi:MAG: hypothetical protein DHS20C17_09030 [Cyclobacteriaceae bacterium]|nr:MAG: hypothetical protein DHS20C17_09030 [Cyclobacteriaceae bacterium]